MSSTLSKTQKRFRCSKGHRQVPPKSKNCVRVGMGKGKAYYIKPRNDGTYNSRDVSTLTESVNSIYSLERKNGLSKAYIMKEFVKSNGEMFGYRKAAAGEHKPRRYTKKDLDRLKMFGK